MSQFLKTILGEYREWKMGNIFERAKIMDTAEIYDELYGRRPPLPPPACARLQHINPWPIWGMIWSPWEKSGILPIFNHDPLTLEMDKLLSSNPLNYFRHSFGILDQWPRFVGMIPDDINRPIESKAWTDGDTLRIEYSMDFAFKISLRGWRNRRRHQLRPRNPFRKPLIYTYK